MAEYTPTAESRRPSVRVLALQVRSVDLRPVFWGLEEEGIPVEVHEVSQGKAVSLAKEAAHMSPLNVGIGVNGIEGILALHHRDLPAEQPLFVVSLRDVPMQQLRCLGINAARLVQGEPLVLQDEAVFDDQAKDSPDVSAVSNELVEQIVQSVLAELAKA
jgi:hypothetical protein